MKTKGNFFLKKAEKVESRKKLLKVKKMRKLAGLLGLQQFCAINQRIFSGIAFNNQKHSTFRGTIERNTPKANGQFSGFK